jgi:hypothetical protein
LFLPVFSTGKRTSLHPFSGPRSGAGKTESAKLIMSFIAEAIRLAAENMVDVDGRWVCPKMDRNMY